jgi:hypothetical protein
MSVFIDSANRFHNEHGATLALTCPHCQVYSHMTLLAAPRFEDLMAHKPRHVGTVYACDSCHGPVFLRYAAKVYAASRVELSSQFSEVERAREKFSFTYLPEEIERLFREALICYTHDACNAFASMCRRVAQATFADLGEAGKLRLFDQLNEVREMASIDEDTFAVVKRVIFSSDTDSRPSIPLFDSYQAGVLLETMKDLLHQAYVRRGRLQQAMMVRRFLADEAADKVTQFPKSG